MPAARWSSRRRSASTSSARTKPTDCCSTILRTRPQRFGVTDAVRNCTPDRFLTEGETVSFGEHIFEVLHCPGHAPGHVVYFNRAARFAHVGDVLFRGSVGRTDLPGGNHATLISSIKEKLLPLGDDIGFICGHGPGGRFGDERGEIHSWYEKAPLLPAALLRANERICVQFAMQKCCSPS